MGGMPANCTKRVHTVHSAGACSTGDNVQKLSPAENTAVGVSAGVIEVVMLQPMLYCKNATQQRLPFTMDPRILYRGVGMSIINMGVLTGVQFPITGFIQRFTTGGVVRKLKPAEQIGCGFGGGFISGFICAPMCVPHRALRAAAAPSRRCPCAQGAHHDSAAAERRVAFQARRACHRRVRARAARNLHLRTPPAPPSPPPPPRAPSVALATPRLPWRPCRFGSLFRGLATSCGREGLFTAGYLGIGPVFAERLRNQYDLEPKTSQAHCPVLLAHAPSQPSLSLASRAISLLLGSLSARRAPA